MSRLVLIIMLFCSLNVSGQYIPMPVADASWRYRINDIDGPITFVLDQEITYNGMDTLANGHVYHQLISRVHETSGSGFYNPPVINDTANHPDVYYAAIREDAGKIYELESTSEKLLFDFNAAVGDSIPGYAGPVRVTAIDSILLSDGAYHKQWHTADTGFSAIEGVGSSRGLFPNYVSGDNTVLFYCFAHDSTQYSSDSTIPCTYVYPITYIPTRVDVQTMDHIDVYPVPASDVLHVNMPGNGAWLLSVMNVQEQVIWTGNGSKPIDIQVTSWSRGIYYLHFYNSDDGINEMKKVVVQ